MYVAVCVGHPGDTTIAEPIGRSQKNRQLMCTYDGPPGKPAVSHVKTIAFDGRLSVCLVRIETGRYVLLSVSTIGVGLTHAAALWLYTERTKFVYIYSIAERLFWETMHMEVPTGTGVISAATASVDRFCMHTK